MSYTIKPLDWQDRHDGSKVAFTPIGRVEITSYSAGYGVQIGDLFAANFGTQREAEATAAYEYEKIVRACIL